MQATGDGVVPNINLSIPPQDVMHHVVPLPVVSPATGQGAPELAQQAKELNSH